MATRNIVPRADGEGKLGTTAKKWGEVHAGAVAAESVTSTGAVKTTGITTRQNSTAYAVEDVAFSASIPGKLVLQCTTAGTTAASEPDMSGAAAGGTVTDGTVVWTYVKILSGDGAPLGTILPFPANGTNPSGYLDCDGSAVSRTMYPDLFALIGTTYGAGDGSTTFNLPDLSDGRFLEGSTTAGTAHAAGLPNIEGYGFARGLTSGYPTIGNTAGAFANEVIGYEGSLQITSTSAAATKFSFDASRSSAIYGNSSTVQPKSLTVRYIIKAFDGQTANSALIDVTQYAQDLANKASRGLDNLTQAGEDHYLEQDYTIIYPNNGSESNPANVTNNSRYVMSNPFSGYIVYCLAEVFVNNEWGATGWFSYRGGEGAMNSYGAKANQLNDGSIVIQTGAAAVILSSALCGSPISNGTTLISAPCRVKVWKIGKVASA